MKAWRPLVGTGIAATCGLGTGCVTLSTYRAEEAQRQVVEKDNHRLSEEQAALKARFEKLVADHRTSTKGLGECSVAGEALQKQLDAQVIARDSLQRMLQVEKQQAKEEQEKLTLRAADLEAQANALKERGSAAIKKLTAGNDELQQRNAAELARLNADLKKTQDEAKRVQVELAALRAASAGEKAAHETAEKLMKEQQARMERDLTTEIQSGKVLLQKFQNRLVIQVDTEIAFPSGSDALKDDVKTALTHIADVVREYPDHDVRVEGHTDNAPIHTVRFPNNWSLSTARAVSVLTYLVDGAGLGPERVSAVGYGEFHPVAANDTEANRRKNRRVEIVVAPRQRTQSVGAQAAF